MHEATVYQCRCPDCSSSEDHPDQRLHGQFNLLLSRLDEQQARWVVAWEAKRLGHGGDTRMALITGMHPQTIRRGREELEANLEGRPLEGVRLPGGGRPPVEKKMLPSNAT